jgi:uncharacterized membrane protein YhaH (DUF805 family)
MTGGWRYDRARQARMSMRDLFFGFRGRIDRKTWWLGFALVLVVQIGLIAWVDPDYFADDPETAATPNLAHFLIALFFLVPSTAITVKRFNDRSYPWWPGYAIGALSAVYVIAEYAGYFQGNPEDFPLPEAIFFWMLGAIGLFFIIDNGFMRGVRGPNAYGPDPRQDQEMDA